MIRQLSSRPSISKAEGDHTEDPSIGSSRNAAQAPSGCSVLFKTAADIHATAVADSSASAPQTAKIRKDTVLEKYHFWCAFGPEDHSSNLPAEKREQGERRRLTKHGESIKRGCQAQFSVTVRAKQPTKLSCASTTETISISKDSRVMGQSAHLLGDTTPTLTCQRRAKQLWKPSSWPQSPPLRSQRQPSSLCPVNISHRCWRRWANNRRQGCRRRRSMPKRGPEQNCKQRSSQNLGPLAAKQLQKLTAAAMPLAKRTKAMRQTCQSNRNQLQAPSSHCPAITCLAYKVQPPSSTHPSTAAAPERRLAKALP